MIEHGDTMNPEIVDKEFHAKTEALVEAAMSLLVSSVRKGEQIPSEITETHKITGPGGWSQDYESTPDYSRFIGRHQKEIEALSEFGLWSEATRTDSVISKHVGKAVGTRRGMMGRSAWEYLRHLLLRQLSSGKLEFDREIFDKTYRDMERFFYSETVEFRAFSPLQNFESDVDVIDFGGGLKIRKTTHLELEQLLDASRLSSFVPFTEIITFKYAMELTFETEKFFDVLPPPSRKPAPEDEAFGKLLTALRLFKAGSTGFNFIQERPLIDTPALFGGTRGGLSYRHYWGLRYSLTGQEVHDFQEFWKVLTMIGFEQRAPISIAVTRFNFAYERALLEDKLLDYMIAFEALFFKTGEIGENRHKLSVRVARLLAEDFEDRRRIAKEMAGFYDMRNLVVHGEQASLKGEFIEKIESYLRDSIKHFLQRPQTADHDEVISRLDLG